MHHRLTCLIDNLGMRLGSFGPQGTMRARFIVDPILTFAIRRGWDALADGIEES